MKKGSALQLVLYGLAIRQLGFEEVVLCLVKRDSMKLEKQSLEKLLEEETFFKGLELIAVSGIFGDRGEKRFNFAYAGEYPVATLFTDPEILEKKWALTNPLLMEFST